MRYEDLRVYKGLKTACDHCHRPFKPGEVITAPEEHAFCYSDGDGGCMIAWVFTTGQPMFGGDPVRFGSTVVEVQNQTPNYPNTPLPDGYQLETLATATSGKSSLWDRIKRLVLFR